MSAEADLKAVLTVAENLETERNQLREQLNKTHPRLEKHGANEAYLALREVKAGDSTKQIPVAWSIKDVPDLVIDLNAKGEVLGIEFLDANKQLGAPQ